MKRIFINFITTLKKYKASSILNILGMSVAFASAYILLVQVFYDFNYNKAIKDSDRICRIEMASWYEEGEFNDYLNHQIPQHVIDNMPQIEAGCQTYLNVPDRRTFTINRDNAIEHYDINCSSGTMSTFDVFEFDMIKGSYADMESKQSIIISRSAAERLKLDIGDVLYSGLATNDKYSVSIVGVFKDFSKGTDLSDLEVFSVTKEEDFKDPSEWSYPHYAKIAPGSNLDSLAVQMSDLAYKYSIADADMSTTTEETLKFAKKRTTMRLLPLTETYFDTKVSSPDGRSGNKTTSVTLLCIAILIIAIAFINFINFFFALVPLRIRSVNTRKIFGASKGSLYLSLIVESLGLIIIALIVAGCIVSLCQGTIIASYLSTSIMLGENISVVVLIVVTAFVMGILATIYPAWYVTSFPPAMVIKGSFSSSKSGKALRYSLIGLQFIISMCLIASAVFIKLQHDYMMKYDMGFNKECLLTTSVSNSIAKASSVGAFEDKLKANPQIKDIAWAGGDIVSVSRMGWGRDFKGENINFQCYTVSYNFLQFMGIKVIEGRDFSRSDELSENGVILFNESAKKKFNMTLEDKVWGHRAESEIVGFCEDFNFKPLQYDIAPFAFYVFGANPWRANRHCYIRTTAGADYSSVIKYIEKSIAEMDPSMMKEHIKVDFFDKELGKQYEQEYKLTILITLFSVISIIIALMGVFGLVLFETQYRRKEIGARRVLGATVGEILSIFNKRFAIIVGICFIIACPICYLIIDKWLSSYSYHIPIYWWVFALTLVIVMIITITTVTLRSLHAASENPVNSLKTE
ncbi:MAG: ABC transporter permease [Bacteroidales bacterium]|nr:ABC transporter permease [Bacteroidales bacterium]MDD4670812.1 ABC transporter permease [Bacteroidales bacterium]